MNAQRSGGNGEGGSLRTLFRSFVDFAALVIGITSGVASLAGFSTGAARRILQAIGIICLLFLVIRSWHLYYVTKNRQLKKELENATQRMSIQQAGHQKYIDAIERVIDRQTPLFEDQLEVTVVIGEDDDGDTVLERWHTTPKPQVTHRANRPIVPIDEARTVRLEDVEFKCDLTDGAGRITYLPLVERVNYLRVWLVFEPALTEPADWVVQYRPKGLWRPLRERGWDRLGWDDRLPNANGDAQSRSGSRWGTGARTAGPASSLTDFRVTFVFPDSERAPRVTERAGRGTVSPAQKNQAGQWVITWQDPRPAGRHYQWDLAR